MYQYFVGLDVHKQVIAYCIKAADGAIINEGSIKASRFDIDQWVGSIPGPWRGGLEATMFSHWIYRRLAPHAARLDLGNPARMKAICSGKKKSDKLDARTLADLLRCDMFPVAYVMPPELEGLRRQLRFRRLVVQETTVFKNRTASLLMETGIEYEKRRLHGKRYFKELLTGNEFIDSELRPLLQHSRKQIESLDGINDQILATLTRHPQLKQRVLALSAIQGVGPVTALTWALEVAEPQRFSSIKKAVSFAGLCSALRESAGRIQRGPLSKHRNQHLQSALIEAAKIAPIWNPTLRAVHEKAKQKGNANEATIAVARKLVAYLLAADRAFHTTGLSAAKPDGVCSGMPDLSE